MARVTVEDCIRFVPNRFELVIMAANRTRQLSRGSEPMVDLENDKFTVVSLREIGDGVMDPEELLMAEDPSLMEEEEEEEEVDGETRAFISEEMEVAGVSLLPEGGDEFADEAGADEEEDLAGLDDLADAGDDFAE